MEEQKKKILVVDPDKETRQMVVKELTRQGYRVLTANMPVRVLSLVNAGIGLVIADGVIGKPHRTVEAVDWAKMICANVPVILFTKSLHHFDMSHVVYVQKSDGVDALVNRVAEL